MFKDKRPEVLVVGAGPVGMLAALALNKRGAGVGIVDTGVWPCQHSYALALHAASLDLLDSLGLEAAARAAACPVKGLSLCDRGGEKLAVALREIAVTRQDALESMLEAALKSAGVGIDWRHEVFGLEAAGPAVRVTVNRLGKESRGYAVAHTEWVVEEQRSLDVPFVVGADGYNSRVRRALGIDFSETAPADYYAVFEFETSADLENRIRLVFGQDTTDVLWPLPGRAARWSLQLPGYADPGVEQMRNRLSDAGLGYIPTERTKDRTEGAPGDHLAELDESRLARLLDERAPWFAGKIGNLTWKTVVRFEQRQAGSYGSGRMWLAGDAAHLAPPAAIRSMNLGLQEACDLAAALAAVLKDGASTGVLDDYGRRWLAGWRRVGGLKPTPGAHPFVQRHAAQIAASLPASGEDLPTLARQLGFSL